MRQVNVTGAKELFPRSRKRCRSEHLHSTTRPRAAMEVDSDVVKNFDMKIRERKDRLLAEIATR